MTTVQLTPAEVAAWADVPEGGTFLLVREPSCDLRCDNCGGSASLPFEMTCADHRPVRTPPAEFVQACAPCETCGNARRRTVRDLSGVETFGVTCPDCRIELVGPCPTCLGKTGWHGRDVPRTGVHNADRWFPCNRCRADHYSAPTGTVILGHAYAVGQPLPIIYAPSLDDDWPPHSYVAFHRSGRLHVWRYTDDPRWWTNYGPIADRLAHYGPPESLVGKWAVELRRA